MLLDEKRSLRLPDRVTTVRLEAPFWLILEHMARDGDVTMAGLVAGIDADRQTAATPRQDGWTLASCLRVACLEYTQTVGERP